MGCSTSDSKNQQQNTELIFPPRPKVGEVVLKVSPRNNIEAGAVDSKNNFDAEGCESIQKSGDGTQTQNVVEQPYTMQMLMQHAVTVLQTPEAEINAQIVCVNEEGNDIGTFELNDVQKALELPFVSEIKICLKKQLESQRQSEEKQVRLSTMFPAVASPKRDLVASAVPVEEEPDDFFEASDQGNFGILFRMQKRILC